MNAMGYYGNQFGSGLSAEFRSKYKQARRKTYGKNRGLYPKNRVQRNTAAIARLKGGEGLELKFFDTSLAVTSIANAATMVGGELDPTTLDCLNSMAQSDTSSGRFGRFINMKSIKVSGRLQFAGQEGIVNPPSLPIVTLFLVMDKQTNKVQLDSEDVFTNPGSSIVLLSNLFVDMENTDKFQILDSIKVPMVTQVTQAGANDYSHASAEAVFHLNYKWKRGKRVLFVGSAGTVANIADNSLHVVGFVNANTEVDVTYNARLRYTSS